MMTATHLSNRHPLFLHQSLFKK